MEKAQFSIGQVVHHKLFGYRGVVIDVDATYMGTKEWYNTNALSQPPKDKPWYHVLVDATEQRTYVSERNLEVDPIGEPIEHPDTEYFFSGYKDGKYILKFSSN